MSVKVWTSAFFLARSPGSPAVVDDFALLQEDAESGLAKGESAVAFAVDEESSESDYDDYEYDLKASRAHRRNKLLQEREAKIQARRMRTQGGAAAAARPAMSGLLPQLHYNGCVSKYIVLSTCPCTRTSAVQYLSTSEHVVSISDLMLRSSLTPF